MESNQDIIEEKLREDWAYFSDHYRAGFSWCRKNVFKGAGFGDRYVTKCGKRAVFIEPDFTGGRVVLVVEGSNAFAKYWPNGALCGRDAADPNGECYDIVRKDE